MTKKKHTFWTTCSDKASIFQCYWLDIYFCSAGLEQAFHLSSHIRCEWPRHQQSQGAMSTQSVIAVKQFSGPDKIAQAYTVPQPSAHVLSNANYDYDLCGSTNSTSLSCAIQSSNIKTESISSSSLPKILPFSTDSNGESSLSRMSQAEFSDPILSSSSTFCTSLYTSSPMNSGSCRKTGYLPFLPQPPKCEQQQNSVGQSSSSLMLLDADLRNSGHADDEHTDDLKDFLNLSSDCSFHGKCSAMAYNEQMEFQFLSEQLGIAISNNEESPRLDVSSLASSLIFLY